MAHPSDCSFADVDVQVDKVLERMVVRMRDSYTQRDYEFVVPFHLARALYAIVGANVHAEPDLYPDFVARKKRGA